MEILLLGQVQIRMDGRPISLGVRKQQFVLAMLALEANKPISTDRLIELAWPHDPPRTARGMIHTCVSRLRGVLAGANARDYGVSLDTEDSGYLLRCDPSRIDVHRFRTLLAGAYQCLDDEHRLTLLDQALSLWRGPPLAGAATEAVRSLIGRSLEELRLTAIEDRIETCLRLGKLDGLLAELMTLTSEHPHRPRLTSALMRELHRTGRTSEALETYRGAREWMREELGLDPPEQLQQLHQDLLRDGPTSMTSAGWNALPVPRELPGDLPTFTGRLAELKQLISPVHAAIVAIDGMAGIGKTALAVHAGHRLADRFPDGQVFIDLHGFTRGVRQVEPDHALDRVLRALGIPGAQIPRELDARAACFRTRLADKRMLLVLDNALDEEQVQPLLPGAPGCLVLITSRRTLSGIDGGQQLSLDILPALDASTLFTRIAGRDNPPDVVKEIVELCGRMPLAIRIAAARLRARPSWTARYLATRLHDERHRLAELNTGSRSFSTAVDLSYDHLGTDQQRLYRLLGLHPGPDCDTLAAAALTQASKQEVERLLDDLTGCHLLHEPSPGRFRFHDLIRAHAADTAQRLETDASRRIALKSLFDHYTEAAAAAVAVVSDSSLKEPQQAAEWLDSEIANLLAVAGNAAENDSPVHTMRLSAILHDYLHTHARYAEAHALHTQALDAARSLGHRAYEAIALRDLGDTEYGHTHYEPALSHFNEALHIARDIGHRAVQAKALIGLGHVRRRQCRHRAAADSYGEALQIARRIGDRTGEFTAVRGLGNIHYMEGEYESAAERFRQVLQLARLAGNRTGELAGLNSIAHVFRRQRRYELATEHFHQAIDLARAIGEPASELNALHGLGHTNLAQGLHRQAIDHLQHALRVAKLIGDRNGELEALHGLADTVRATGHLDLALSRHLAALDLARSLGQPGDQARAHDGLAQVFRDLFLYDKAREHWRQALGILNDLNVSQIDDISAEQIAWQLAELDSLQSGVD
ncbi:AfsR/SARP family transcriptional regulator [Nonomuraea sp. LPB2021202275-12-8]|uniref:AfsR/SARP family transcriptional regulator n=1 Tax=Nonomuraea sp. LPB2021202275-12-8 TaxID=3120159 RepID=UPI00300CAC13